MKSLFFRYILFLKNDKNVFGLKGLGGYMNKIKMLFIYYLFYLENLV